MKRKPTPKRVEAKVERWNRRYPVGTPVIVQRDNGDLYTTRTRSEASLLPSGTAVIWVDGISGCYSLDRVKPVSEFK